VSLAGWGAAVAIWIQIAATVQRHVARVRDDFGTTSMILRRRKASCDQARSCTDLLASDLAQRDIWIDCRRRCAGRTAGLAF